MSQNPITVAVGGRHPLDRAGLAALVAGLPGLRLVALDAHPSPRVLVWDPGYPPAGAGEAPGPPSTGHPHAAYPHAAYPRAAYPRAAPETALLLVVGETADLELPVAVAASATVAGLFSKDETPEALGVAIRQVARGEQYLSPSLVLAILERRKNAASLPERDPSTSSRQGAGSAGQVLSALTDREREVLALLAEGLSNKAIAARLYLSVRTVEGHLAKLYARLGVHSRVEAALIAVQHNLHKYPS